VTNDPAVQAKWTKPADPATGFPGRGATNQLPPYVYPNNQDAATIWFHDHSMIVEAVKRTLERTPPELAADIVDRGIMLAGGGALVRGICDLISHETGILTHVAEEPLLCVVNGCGMVLEDFERLKRVLDTPDFARPAA